MGIIGFIKKKGISATIKAILYRLFNPINKVIFLVLSKCFPVVNKRIALESEGDFSDNAYALYSYMIESGIVKEYEVIWLVDNLNLAKNKKLPNTKCVMKRPPYISFWRSYYLATCEWYIYDHNDLLTPFGKRAEQTQLYLCHGFAGYKAGKAANGERAINYSDYIITTGKIPSEVVGLYSEYPNAELLELGFPRTDYFFSKRRLDKCEFFSKYCGHVVNKIILWMPTYRESTIIAFTEEYQVSETHLPLLETYDKLEKFNHFLAENNDVVFLKIHHMQRNLDVFKKKYSNIYFISDADIHALGLQLYEFIAMTDALITDYSSISADYMLLDKPMVFILDDYDEYKKSRGIIPENALELMKGDHVTTYEEFIEAVERIHEGEDIHKDERRKLLGDFYTYADGRSAERIMNFVSERLH